MIVLSLVSKHFIFSKKNLYGLHVESVLKALKNLSYECHVEHVLQKNGQLMSADNLCPSVVMSIIDDLYK